MKVDATMPLSEVQQREDVYDPLKHRPESARRLGDLGVAMHLFKSVIGVGLLSMPYAFRSAGIAMGFILTFIIGGLFIVNGYMLVIVSREQCTRLKVPMLDFGDTGMHTFLNGPRTFRRFAKLLKIVINSFVTFQYMGFCTVYTSFIGTQVKQVVECPVTDESSTISIYAYIAMFLPPYIIAVQFRRLSHIQYLSLMANVMYLGVVSILVYAIVKGPMADLSNLPVYAPVDGYATAINVIMFTSVNMGAVLPIENEMKNPERYLGLKGLYTITQSFIVLLLAAVGFFAYWRYGGLSQEMISLNLDQTLGLVVTILLLLVIYVSYVLYMFVPLDVIIKLIRDPIGQRVESERYRVLTETLIRAAFAIFTVVLAIAVPQISAIIGLVSAIVLTTLSIFLPSFLALVTFWKTTNMLKKALLIFQIVIFPFLFAIGLYAAINTIITVDPNESFCPKPIGD